MVRKSIVTSAVALAVALMATVGAAPAGASAQVRRGATSAFAAAVAQGYGTITGHAQLVVTADGRTIASEHVEGLEANQTYPSHVHANRCEDNAAGGHYQNVPGGPADAVNEIWLTFTTNDDGVGSGNARNDFAARLDDPAASNARSIVVHDWRVVNGVHPKIACANLD
jgi:hypothetical protein